jgi:uncharacterized SAM-binding protein YcdF (DUF218 family)
MRLARILAISHLVGTVLAEVVLILLVFVSLRFAFLGAAGRFLVHEDALQKSEAIFALSGNAEDRGPEAARLFQAGWAPLIVCTGELVPRILTEVGLPVREAELTAKLVRQQGVDSSHILKWYHGTSTWEECLSIAELSKSRGWKRIIIVSSLQHTRRIQRVVDRTLRNQGLVVIVRGAPSSSYEEARWWANEEGLLFVNNEYIKLAYYQLKYF